MQLIQEIFHYVAGVCFIGPHLCRFPAHPASEDARNPYLGSRQGAIIQHSFEGKISAARENLLKGIAGEGPKLILENYVEVVHQNTKNILHSICGQTHHLYNVMALASAPWLVDISFNNMSDWPCNGQKRCVSLETLIRNSSASIFINIQGHYLTAGVMDV
jgi:hypothetical protein